MKQITSLDRFVLYLDRTLVFLAVVLFLWVQSVHGDFVPLILGIACMVGWVFTSRHLLGVFKKPEDGETKKEETKP